MIVPVHMGAQAVLQIPEVTHIAECSIAEYSIYLV